MAYILRVCAGRYHCVMQFIPAAHVKDMAVWRPCCSASKWEEAFRFPEGNRRRQKSLVLPHSENNGRNCPDRGRPQPRKITAKAQRQHDITKKKSL
jgi:hypothetical protein